MQKLIRCTLFTGIFMASAIASAAESGFFFGAEYNLGGAKVYPNPEVTGTNADQKPQVDMREGDNTALKVGYDWLIGDSLALRGAVGYAWASEKMNDTKTDHIPVELLVFYRKNNHRFGVGPVLHLQRKVESTFSYKVGNTTSSVDYHTATSGSDSISPGLKFEYDYEPSWGQGFYLGLQYTYMRYEYDQKLYIWQGTDTTTTPNTLGSVIDRYSGKQNASSAGVTLGYRF